MVKKPLLVTSSLVIPYIYITLPRTKENIVIKS